MNKYNEIYICARSFKVKMRMGACTVFYGTTSVHLFKLKKH